MSNQDLYPIVITPLTVVVHGSEYRCSGNGLLKNGHSFQSDLTDYLPLLEPKRTKAGKVAARQPEPVKKSKDWWQAQCAFRNLSQSGNISQLQDKLRSADQKRMSNELLEAEVRLNREFKEQNAAVRDSKWKAMTTDEAKAEADPARFLRERFAEGNGKKTKAQKNNTVVVLQTHNRMALHQAADTLGLQHSSADAPLNSDGSRPAVDRWIVIGRDHLSVNKKIEEIGRQTKSSIAKKKQVKESQTQVRHAEVVKKASAKKSAKWDVVGTWAISCPYVERNWGRGAGDDECTLTIHETIDGPAKQIWAEFDFIVVTGVLRFVRPPTGQQQQQVVSPAAKGQKKRKREESEERNQPNVGVGGYRVGDAGRVSFLLNPDTTPSPSHPTWQYRWRGEETGEDVIELGSDRVSYSITFAGPRGTELRGTFGGAAAVGDCTFTGRKISSGGRDGAANSYYHYLSVEDEWSRRSEAAYEHARVARWH